MSASRSVAELMSPPSLRLRPRTTVREAEEALGKKRVTGAPVVDDDGRAVGVVSQHDLIVYVSGRTSAGEAGTFYTDVADYKDLADVAIDRGNTPVEEIMTRDVVCVDRSASATEAAHLMRERRIHRLLVTDSGVLVGIITSLDLLAVLDHVGLGEGPL
jgi:CBS domain-containing protein